jgi:membrane-associated phospholipid phosphatase
VSLIGAAVTAFAVYAALWIGIVANWRLLAAIDDGSLRRFYDYGADRPGWISLWVAVSNLFSPTTMRILALAGIAVALIRRNGRTAVFLTITVMVMGLLTVVAKDLSGRSRPTTALIGQTSSAFPSGHALGIMVSVLAFLTVLWPMLAPRMRWPAAILGAMIVFVVGLARVVLNVHHTTDVVAGWALGLGYYLLCVMLVPLRPGISDSPDQVPQRYRV